MKGTVIFICVCDNDIVFFLLLFLKVQKHVLSQRPAPDLPYIHLCERGAVGDPAICALGRQSHSTSSAEGDHPSRR